MAHILRWIGSGFVGLKVLVTLGNLYPSFHFPMLLHAGVMTVLMLLALKSCKFFPDMDQDRRVFQAGEVLSVQTPLLLPKDDDVSSWGSSYDITSHDEDDPGELGAGCSLEGKALYEGENNNDNPQRLCIICLDATRDCFFLPCGHCAACFTCGTRYLYTFFLP